MWLAFPIWVVMLKSSRGRGAIVFHPNKLFTLNYNSFFLLLSLSFPCTPSLSLFPSCFHFLSLSQFEFSSSNFKVLFLPFVFINISTFTWRRIWGGRRGEGQIFCCICCPCVSVWVFACEGMVFIWNKPETRDVIANHDECVRESTPVETTEPPRTSDCHTMCDPRDREWHINSANTVWDNSLFKNKNWNREISEGTKWRLIVPYHRMIGRFVEQSHPSKWREEIPLHTMLLLIMMISELSFTHNTLSTHNTLNSHTAHSTHTQHTQYTQHAQHKYNTQHT